MAFAYAKTKSTVYGNMKIATGSYTSTGSGTGGDIVTGMKEVLFFNTNCEKSQAATIN